MAVGALTLLLVIPAVGAPLTYLVGRSDSGARGAGLLFSGIALALNLGLLLRFPFGEPGIQLTESLPWIPQIGATYVVGADAMAISLVLLTTLLTFLSCVFTWDETHRTREFYSLMLLMEATVLGVFLSLDYLLFFFFWEASLLPMYFLIIVWGGPKRRYAAIKFFLYTQAASLLVLLGIMAMVLHHDAVTGTLTFAFDAVQSTSPTIATAVQALLFIGFLIGFGTKLPVWPVHTWLPDAHVQAPTAGSVLLAGVLLKMGGYGLVRIALPNLPTGAVLAQPIMLTIAIVTILYGAMLCLDQQDLKSMIAYSSISHMGMVLLGIATLDAIGLAGAIWMMFAHGLISGGMFMVAGVVQHGLGTRMIPDLGGIAKVVPRTSAVTLTLFMASLGLPGMVGFVAEIMIFIGTWRAFEFLVLLPIVGVVLTAAYFTWAMQRALFGPVAERFRAAVSGAGEGAGDAGPVVSGASGHGGGHGGGHDAQAHHEETAGPGGTPHAGHLSDLHWYEALPLAVLVVLVVAFGMWPAPLANPIIEGSRAVLETMAVQGVGAL